MNIRYDYTELISRINKYYHNINDFAKDINISYELLNRKLNNQEPFLQEEINDILIKLNINSNEIQDIFFNKIVKNNSTV